MEHSFDGGWVAFIGPAGLSQEVASRLSHALRAATKHPDVRERIERETFAVRAQSPDELTAQTRRKLDKLWAIGKVRGARPGTQPARASAEAASVELGNCIGYRLHASGVVRWLSVQKPNPWRSGRTGTPPLTKYEADGGPGLGTLFSILQQSVDAGRDLRTLMASQVLFWMLRAPDGHAKNFSIHILPRGRYRLTPLYDVMSAYPVMGDRHSQWSKRELKPAMALVGKNRHYRAEQIQRQLPQGFSQEVADKILGGLRSAARTLANMPAS